MEIKLTGFLTLKAQKKNDMAGVAKAEEEAKKTNEANAPATPEAPKGDK